MHFLLAIFLYVMVLNIEGHAQTAPNISANALFLYRNSNFHKEDSGQSTLDSSPNGIAVREAEVQIFSDVDPYTRLNILLSIGPTLSTDSANGGSKVEEKWGLEPEEAFAESNVISNVTLKFGKFKAFMGKHNLQHTHAYAFIDAPLANTQLLGDEGLNDVGISAALLLPFSWYSEMTFQTLRGKGENEEFNSPSPGQSVGLVHWKNLSDVTDDLTVEIGVSYADGGNSFGQRTSLSGGDLTFKWKPADGGKYRSIVWATEYLSRTQSQASLDDEVGSGLASWIQYQIAERWSALYRFDSLKMNNSFDVVRLPNDTRTRHSVGIQFSPTEFSSYKLEVNQRTGGPKSLNNESVENSVFLQANFTIGAHPAHAY